MSTSALAREPIPRESKRPTRLAIFTSHPIQYQAPYFRELARRPGVRPLVMFGSRHGLDVSLDRGFGARFQWDIPLLEGYEHEFVENVSDAPDVDHFAGTRLRDARALLAARGAEAVLVLGWQSRAHVQMMRAAWSLGLPLLVRGESNLLRRAAPGLRSLARSVLWLPLRKVLYRAAFARVDEFLVIGTRNAEFYREFGVPERKLRWAPYAVDNDHFALPSQERAAARSRRRAELGISEGAIVFVSSAKLIPRKRPLDLVAAFAHVARSRQDVHLVFLGDGPERASVEAQVESLGLRGRVSITGFVNQRAIPEWYAMADCVVLPSDHLETWGLAINEGMAAGLAAIVSDVVGCAPDLVRDGENGWQFPFGDVAALADRIDRYARTAPLAREAMSARSREIVAGFTLRQVADATEAALAAVSRVSEPRGGGR